MKYVPSDSWQNSLQLGLTYTIAQFTSFLPRLVGAFLVFVIGLLIARFIRSLVIRTLETLRVSKMVEKTPLELFFKNAEFGQKIEVVIGSVFYWLFLFLVVYTSVSILGLTPLSIFMDRILSYIPHIFSALIIFFFGVLLAGIAESVVKSGLRSLEAQSARLLAKTVSYGVVTIAAVAELGIASQFITILFFGVVLLFALGGGLALGLGGQFTVKKILEEWYQKSK